MASACQIDGGLSKMVGKVLRYGVTHCRDLLQINHVFMIGRRARCLWMVRKEQGRP